MYICHSFITFPSRPPPPNHCNIYDQRCNFYSIQQEYVSRESVYQLDTRNDHSNRNTASNAPITERDEMRNQRGIDDQEMESILIWDKQTRRMESIDRTLSPLKVTFADLDDSFLTVTAN